MIWAPAGPKDVGGLEEAEVTRDEDGEILAIVCPWTVREDGVVTWSGYRWTVPALGERGMSPTSVEAKAAAEAAIGGAP